jgi:uncharacterized protein YaaQ
MNTLMKITPYEFERIGNTTFIINLNGERFLTLENTTKEHVERTTQLLNGAFREGVIFGQFNKIENL